MKSKNIIINTCPEITNEELEGYKDFDTVLKGFDNNGGYASKTKIRDKVIIGSVVLVVLIGCSTYYFANFSKIEKTIIAEVEQSLSATPNQENEIRSSIAPEAPEIKPKDAAVNDEEVNEQKPEKGSIKKKTPDVFQKDGLNDKRSEIENKQAIEPDYTYIEAEPVEGMPYLYAYFEKKLTYPEVLKKDSIEGMVLIQFSVLTDSTIANVNIVKSLGDQFDKEAIRVIANMPKWKPATVNNIPVNSRISIPLTFAIKK